MCVTNCVQGGYQKYLRSQLVSTFDMEDIEQSPRKMTAAVFWDKNAFMERGTIIAAATYYDTLTKPKLVYLHDNTRPHIAAPTK